MGVGVCLSQDGTFELKVMKGGGNSVPDRGNSLLEGLRLEKLWSSDQKMSCGTGEHERQKVAHGAVVGWQELGVRGRVDLFS